MFKIDKAMTPFTILLVQYKQSFLKTTWQDWTPFLKKMSKAQKTVTWHLLKSLSKLTDKTLGLFSNLLENQKFTFQTKKHICQYPIFSYENA